MENVKVTVVLSTFNQAPYVRQAIESILMQKTNFLFEVLAADDSSTDGTQEIILEYEKQYPGLIHHYFTPENLGDCKKFTNCVDMGLLHGDYLAHLEGDDYWIREDRLQILADFLDMHPTYSRVSHRTLIVDEDGNKTGYDMPLEKCDRTFTIENFLAGEQYSSVDSMYRNYYKQVGGKYHKLQTASRNVGDFQNMFVTQDFGPVYILPDCLSAYRSRSVQGQSNYNSLIGQEKRALDKINVARAVESFYPGKYDLSPRVRTEQRKLFSLAVRRRNEEILSLARGTADAKTTVRMLAREKYLACRAGDSEGIRFIKAHVLPSEKLILAVNVVLYAALRIMHKLAKKPLEDNRRGYLIDAKGKRYVAAND